MGQELDGKVALITGAASGIGLASAEAMLAAGARVIMADRDESALKALTDKHRDAVISLTVDLLDPEACARLIPSALERAGRIDILHANAGTYIGGDLVDADPAAIDRMLNLNVNVVMKNVRDVLPHMIKRRTGDSSSRAPLPPIFRRPGSLSTPRPNGRSAASSRRCGDRCPSTGSASARSRPVRSQRRS